MDTDSPTETRSTEPSTLLKILHWDKLFESDTPPRLGIEVGKRLPFTALSAFSVGMAIGSSHGSKKAAYRFRAENAHRFPTTSTGWFQYHKTKNYIAIVGGVKEGMKMGFKLSAGALAFCIFEETVDYARHDRRDFLSTVTAGLSFSGIYSLLARHDVYTAARTTKLGLKLSMAYGLMQDALETLKGNRPAYVDFILGNRVSKSED
ncbi:hypothetical protein KXW98_005494 [Aspergillus fumigatus]|uniref:Uncharacterized protein n=3 Tax=Aspergillus fumigatus TaxID=746128 RepID=Q4WI42_ASPFU|nr:conserved hypothetical protein [Aspergillus fumigatus Af293]EDP53977.1 conserved hypothetical protein [Aspergillus fumigatus A1163]KAF4258518.1 hypothetical protein CNMCM8714_002311 [Aspergillus fumigatus]KMK57686.1 hypothetical protein Y699_03106 [Aspergillus fumigatus Z5]EAL87413.1 conserved hypothetical protein [Aspergillus fumigatus Af293]KAF4259791.1 hypothetical protein CNMCM8057_002623 [Aspergillus fumigatus]